MNKTLSSSFVAVLSLAGVSISDYVQAQQPVKPNVIYIYADDMGKKVCCPLMVNGISRHLILMRWLPGDFFR